MDKCTDLEDRQALKVDGFSVIAGPKLSSCALVGLCDVHLKKEAGFWLLVLFIKGCGKKISYLFIHKTIIN